MSRIGYAPIPIPEGVTIEQQNGEITVKGPKGVLSRTLSAEMQISVENGIAHVRRPSDEGRHRAMHGLTRTLLANMVDGVSKGFRKVLELYGMGYRAQMQGTKLSLQLGFSHPVEIIPQDGIELAVVDTAVPTAENHYFVGRIAISGIDKELVGQTAATIKAYKKPEPYKGKGLRYQGERVRRKAGKAAKTQK